MGITAQQSQHIQSQSPQGLFSAQSIVPGAWPVPSTKDGENITHLRLSPPGYPTNISSSSSQVAFHSNASGNIELPVSLYIRDCQQWVNKDPHVRYGSGDSCYPSSESDNDSQVVNDQATRSEPTECCYSSTDNSAELGADWAVHDRDNYHTPTYATSQAPISPNPDKQPYLVGDTVK